MQRITQDIVEDHSAFLRIGDLMWKICIDQGVTPKEFDEKGMMPMDSLEDFMVIMNIAISPGPAISARSSSIFLPVQFRASATSE